MPPGHQRHGPTGKGDAMKLARATRIALAALAAAGGTHVRARDLPPALRPYVDQKGPLLVALNLAYHHGQPGVPDGRNTYTLTTAGRNAAAEFQKEMTRP